MLSKHQGQGLVKKVAEKMLHEFYVTHILWVIWEVEYECGIYFLICQEETSSQVKFGQILECKILPMYAYYVQFIFIIIQ